MTPRLVRAWRLYATLSGLVVLVGGLTAAVLYGTAERGPALTIKGLAYNTTERTKVGGTVSYTVDYQVLASCPAEVISIYRSLSNTEPLRVFESRRPAVFLSPGTYTATPIVQPLPAGVTPGRWDLTIFREARCATQRVIDNIAHFEFTVEP